MATREAEPEHRVKFGPLHPDGTLTNERSIRQSDIVACPHAIFDPSHYREDGTCKCDDPEEQAMMIEDWGYSPEDFNRPTSEEGQQ